MLKLKQIVNTIKDNINYAKIGLGINVHDPWFKNTVETELNNRGIKYISGYEPNDKFYEFAICGGKQEDINDFVKWFKSAGDWKYYFSKHAIFRSKITILVL